MASDKKDEPAKIKAIMHEVLVAPSSESLKVSLLSVFWKKDRINAPTTQSEAASVAVAIPK